MSVIKNTPSQRVINGKMITTSETAVVSEPFYETHGEACIVIHTVIKAMTKVLIVPDIGRIDEDYDELLIERGACVEFRFCAGVWYIISSDGLKQS